MAYTPEALQTRLEELGTQPRYLVAFSGGLDSTVLLGSLVRLIENWSALRLRAAHVDHGLQEDSGRWTAHCSEQSSRWDVPFLCSQVVVEKDSPGGPEAAARTARYQALAELLEPGEVLLTAHHRDDQLETVLLNLLRGSGVKGLGGMPELARFGRGFHARPLLPFRRAELEDYARGAGLSWLDDPSNADRRFDRNYLRHEVLPLLERRWPSAATTVGRNALHIQDAARLLDALAEADLARVGDAESLSVGRLRMLDVARQRNLLRHWIAGLELPVPGSVVLEIIRDVLEARSDSEPKVCWPGAEVRRYGDRLYAMTPLPPVPSGVVGTLTGAGPCELPAPFGTLRITAADTGPRLKHACAENGFKVRFRTGGEKLRLPGREHRHVVKKLFQDKGVLPWMRQRLPFLYVGDRLAAVADLWVDAGFAADSGERGYRVVWEHHPPVHRR